MTLLAMSACFIVKDEERFLERSLKSIRPYVAEIVVLDTGSSDSSVSIAGRHADAVGHFEWIGDFSAARNACAALASHDWIFAMDADEEVVEFDIARVAEIIADERIIGRYGQRDLTESGEDVKTHRVARVYNKKFSAYANPIHETPVPLEAGAPRRLAELPVLADHYGYLAAIASGRGRNARNRELLLLEIEKNPADAYNYYQLGKNYSFAGEKEKACEAFAKALSLESDTRKEYVADLIECYGGSLLDLQRYGEAAELLRYEGDLLSPRNQFSFGMISMNAGLFDKAVACFKRCIVRGSAEPIESSMPRYNMGVIYECTGRISEAREMYAACGGFLPARARLKALGR